MNSNKSWPPPPVREKVVTASQPSEAGKASKYGWIGIGVAVAGLLLPYLTFVLWINYMSRVLLNPEMDDWYMGDGRTDLYFCQIVIVSLELAALAFGVRARRTVPGKIVFLIVVAALFVAYEVLPACYWIGSRF